VTNDTSIRAEDVLPVRSRISWGAIVAGSVLALAFYFLLTLFGSAIGLSIHGNVSDRGLAIGAVIWAILVTAGCLFIGGCIASNLTTGENKVEGVMYGLLVWGVVFAMLIFMLASGARSGFSAMMGMASTSAESGMTWEEMARRSGVPQAEIDRMRTTLPENAAQARAVVTEENATRAAWYSFLGTLISMIAAGLGGFVGAGPTLRLFTLRMERATGVTFDRRDQFVRTS
jgi:hypothetical protein